MAALSTIALASLTAASTANSFIGQRRQAKSLEQQGAYEGQVAELNATLAERQADDAIARGHESELRHRGQVKRFVGSQRAALAAQGVDVNDGSASDVQHESLALGEFDALTIRNNARREAWGYKVQAFDARTRGQMAQASARNQASAMRAQSMGTLLTGGAQMIGIGYQSGMFDKKAPKASTPKGTMVPSNTNYA